MKNALLIGIKKYGRKKSFHDIIAEAGFEADELQRIEIANEFEALGLIKSVTYKLPFEIRAELTAKGHELIRQLESNEKPLLNMVLLLLGPLQISVFPV